MFALLLNILVYIQRNHKSITHHATNENPIKTHRSLCECQLFAPQNYDNDPEMKSVMKDFGRQTSQRFREYDERMTKNRQKCKDQCDKDIQKIILKDKIEKELKEKLATLEANINTKDLPICECEKSLTDKVEKGCLGCGVFGSGIAPNVGLFGEVALGAWKTAALVTAKKLAAEAGAAKGLAEGTQAGIEAIVDLLGSDFGLSTIDVENMGLVFNAQNYKDFQFIYQAVYTEYQKSSCMTSGTVAHKPICDLVYEKTKYAMNVTGEAVSNRDVIESTVKTMVSQTETIAEARTEALTEEAIATLTDLKTGMVQTTYMGYQTVIISSIVAVLVIVLVMVIIYLILRYRRKTKMKKKLQYIKLLRE
ncbi:PIR protein, putative [Plasmodium sp.]|nr:PIR protein, putative [Plasmodium sp.]